jgi:ribonuclease T2
VPSHDVAYDLDDIVDALSAPRIVSPIVACDHGELREAWYFFNVRGSVQTGHFVASEPQVVKQHMKRCPKTGIKYLPKEV